MPARPLLSKEGDLIVTMNSLKRAALLALACGASTPALAQEATHLAAPGALVRPASDDDSTLLDVATDGHSAIQIDVIALDGSDPMLKLLSARNHETVLADNDDGGGGLNARITFDPATMPAALDANGHIALRIEDYSLEGSLGKYAIIASTIDKVAPEKTLSYGASETLDFTDAHKSHFFAFAARQGDLVDIRLTAAKEQQSSDDSEGSGIDPVLKVFNSPFPAIDPIQTNDDGPDGGLDSVLRFAIPATGTYFISAETLNDSRGQATLTLRKAEPLPPPPAPTALSATQLGRGLCGEIAETAPMLDWFDADKHYALYSIAGRRGDALTLTKTGDVTIQAGYMTAGGFAAIAGSGDGDSSSDTQQIQWATNGDVHILVSGSAGSHYGLGSGSADQLARCQ